MENPGLPIIDCHQHFIELTTLALPRVHAAQRWLRGSRWGLRRPAEGIPSRGLRTGRQRTGRRQDRMAEFISDDPMGEVRWAQELAHTTGRPQGMIGLVDGLAHRRTKAMRLGSAPSRPLAPVTTSRSRSLGWNASSASVGRSHRSDRGSSIPLSFSVQIAACSRATCQSASWPATFSSSTLPIFEVIADFSASQKRQMLQDTAAEMYACD